MSLSTVSPEAMRPSVGEIGLDAARDIAELEASVLDKTVEFTSVLAADETIALAEDSDNPGRLGSFIIGEGDAAKPFEVIDLSKFTGVEIADKADSLAYEIDGEKHEMPKGSVFALIGIDPASTPDVPVKKAVAVSEGVTPLRAIEADGSPSNFATVFGIDPSLASPDGSLLEVTAVSGSVVLESKTPSKIEVTTRRPETASEKSERIKTAGEEAGRIVVDAMVEYAEKSSFSVRRAIERDAKREFRTTRRDERDAKTAALKKELNKARDETNTAKYDVWQARQDARRRNIKIEARKHREELLKITAKNIEERRSARQNISAHREKKMLKATKQASKEMAQRNAAYNIEKSLSNLSAKRSNYNQARSNKINNSRYRFKGGRGYSRHESRIGMGALSLEEKKKLLDSSTSVDDRRAILAKAEKAVHGHSSGREWLRIDRAEHTTLAAKKRFERTTTYRARHRMSRLNSKSGHVSRAGS